MAANRKGTGVVMKYIQTHKAKRSYYMNRSYFKRRVLLSVLYICTVYEVKKKYIYIMCIKTVQHSKVFVCLFVFNYLKLSFLTLSSSVLYRIKFSNKFLSFHPRKFS
jgi:hypothetical protein